MISGPKETASAMIAGMGNVAAGAAQLVPGIVVQGTDALRAAFADASAADLVVLASYLVVVAGVVIESRLLWGRPGPAERHGVVSPAVVLAGGSPLCGLAWTAGLR